MKKYRSFFLIILILIFTVSCSQNEIPNIITSSENITSFPNTDFSNSSIKVLSLFSNIETMADLYMEKNKNVKIEVINLSKDKNFKNEQEYQIFLDDYIKRISLEIMSGVQYDIIDIAAFDKYKYIKSGFFVELYQYMNSDSDFNKEDYYTNIFEILEYNEKLYTLPLQFNNIFMAPNKIIFSEFNLTLPRKSIKPIDILKNYEISISTNTFNDLHISNNAMNPPKDLYNNTILSEYINSMEGKTNLENNLDFLNYLELSKNLNTLYSPGKQISIVLAPSKDILENYNILYFFGGNSMSIGIESLKGEERLGDFLPITTNSGNPVVSMKEGVMSILENSSKKEDSWSFLKFCISDYNLEIEANTSTDDFNKEIAEKYKESQNFVYGVPINKKNFSDIFKLNYYIRRTPEDALNNTEEEVFALDELIIKIDEINSSYNFESFENQEIISLIRADLEEFYYYNSSMSKEDISKIIERKIKTYLNE